MRKGILRLNTILLVVLCLLVSLPAHGQGAAAIIKGKLVNAKTGEAIGTTIGFYNSKGKMLKCKSNSSDGTFQQSIKLGDIYTVVIKGFYDKDGFDEIDLISTKKFVEIVKDYKLTQIVPGTVLMEIDAFTKNTTELNEVAREHLLLLKPFKEINFGADFDIKISSIDSWFKNTKKKVEKTNSKGKKYKKTVKVKTKEQLQELLDNRIAIVENFFKENKVSTRDKTITPDLQVVSPKKKQIKKKKTKGKGYEYIDPEYITITVTIRKYKKI
jgi:hypothetical protein